MGISKDMNLAESVGYGILVVDSELCLRTVNKAIAEAFSLGKKDIGHPLEDLIGEVEEGTRLLGEVAQVLETGEPIEREHQLLDGRLYRIELLPHHPSSGNIEGVVLTFTDVTAVRQMEKRFAFALESAGLSWWEWDLKTGRIEVTSGGTCLLGENCLLVDRDHEGWMEMVHPHDREEVRRTLDACLNGETPTWSCDHRFRLGPDSWLWVRNNGVVLKRDASGQPLEMTGTTQDINDSMSALTKVLSQQAHLEATDAISKVGVWDYDVEEKKMYWSAQTRSILEVEDTFVPVVEETYRMMPEEDAARLSEAFENILAEGTPYDLNLNFISARGRRMLCRTACQARYNEQGNLTNVVGIFQDITDLVTSKHTVEAYMKLTPDFQATIDFNGIFKSYNAPWKRLGVNQEEPRKLSLFDIVHPDDRDQLKSLLETVKEGKIVTAHESRTIAVEPRGKPEWMSWSFSGDQKLGLIFVSARCVTEQKRAQKELQDARLRAEEANRAKSDFLAVMSHELRTPLNPIIGFADMLVAGAKTDEDKEMFQSILTSGNNMLSLVNGILDFSKLEAGKTEVQPTDFSLEELVRQKVRLMQGLIKGKAVKLFQSIDWGPVEQSREPVFTGDEEMIRQVCRNLISNAVKFTRRGQVELVVAFGEMSDNHAMATFSVRDTGIGIAEKHLPLLFKPFTQVQTGITREFGGTGLGLAICKRLVELMDGTVSVTSKEGEGSTFSFTIPLGIQYSKAPDMAKAAKPEAVKQVPQSRLEGDVLLVEDDRANTYYIKALLERQGARVMAVPDGESALEHLRKAHVDMVLLDLHMPGIGGLETLKRIRASGQEAISALPVIVLTADVSEEAQESCGQFGATTFLTKPVPAGELHALLEHHLKKTPVLS